MERRNLLKGIAAASVAAPATFLSSTVDAADDKQKMVDFLFVQNASAATLTNGVLTLKGVAPHTLYFSDRPERIAGRITTAEFVEQWSKGSDSFKKDPPNAVLTVLSQPKPQDIVVVLKDPRLQGNDLVFDVDVTDGDKTASGEASALFIDVIGRPATPLSYAGVARRTTRRVVRRNI